MMNKVLAVALLSLSSVAFAETGFYGGIGVGRTSIDVDTAGAQADLASVGITSTVTADDTDTGFKIFGGYQLNQNFAVEFGYADLGKFTATANVTSPVVGTIKADVEASAIFLDAVGSLPLGNQFSLFGRAGIAFTNTENNASGLGVTVSDDEDEANLKVGLGAQFGFTKNVALRAEWERYIDVGEEDTTGESDVDVLGVSLNVKF